MLLQNASQQSSLLGAIAIFFKEAAAGLDKDFAITSISPWAT
jgi:hypothetical protein